MSDYSEGMLRCACCGSVEANSEIDFHHWQYNEEEPGCHLCRGCHEYIHRYTRARHQSSGWHWKRDAVMRLLNLAAEQGNEFDSVEAFCDQFNIPDNVSREQAEKSFDASDFTNHRTARVRHLARYGVSGAEVEA